MRVLVIDDDQGMRTMLRMVLARAGYEVAEADSAAAGLDTLRSEPVPLVLCDIRMPDMDGMAFLDALRTEQLETTVIMMSAYGSVETAIECLKKGAYDYISKPFKTDEVVLTLRKAEERLNLLRENASLKARLNLPGEREIVYCSQAMGELMALVDRVARSDSPALVLGETGTGKELIARALHQRGPRANRPFVAVNCSALAPNLLESELFGHVRGAFTGADRAGEGLFRAADGGTLFLDEIGELPLELQPKLLRVLQEKEVRPVGATKFRRVDVRVIAATGADLSRAVAEGRFRQDLYYRLAVVELKLPPLRQRIEDVPLLADHFLKVHAAREGRPAPRLAPDAAELLCSYDWPGNVRELENFMAKTLIFCRADVLQRADLPWEIRRRPRDESEDFSLKKAIIRLEKEYIAKALR
ncbi:MAG: sigma-54-dependent Fis family transcriptional regulator, partial [Deltaproteobacteria bacterium]